MVSGIVRCERPNNVLDKFEGALVCHDKTLSLDNSNMLLRVGVNRSTACSNTHRNVLHARHTKSFSVMLKMYYWSCGSLLPDDLHSIIENLGWPIYRKVLYKSRGFYDFVGDILQASIWDRLLYKTGISMYVNTKTRLMCDLMGPKLRLLFKCGFYTKLYGILPCDLSSDCGPYVCAFDRCYLSLSLSLSLCFVAGL